MESRNPFDELQDYGQQNQFITFDKKKNKEKKGKPSQEQKNLHHQPDKIDSIYQEIEEKHKQPLHPKNKRHPKPQKGVPSQPHLKDKQSGTGRGTQLKKGGGGRGNWGNQKDQLREEKYQQLEIENKDESEKKEDIVQTQMEEKKLSLDEYYKKKTGITYQQVNQYQEKNKKEKVIKPNIQLGFKTPMEEIENREIIAGSENNKMDYQQVTHQ